MQPLPSIKPEAETKRIVKFIQQTFRSQGFKQAIIAVSGGLDSAFSLALSLKALGQANILSLQLPYHSQSKADSDLVLNHLGVPRGQRLLINIGSIVDELAHKLGAEKDQLRLGNLMVRVRMTCLFDQAKAHQALVIGTSNRSEVLLGYYTRYGDEAADLKPISHLYKTQVYQLAKFLDLPPAIIQTPASAGLWPGQTDAQELGFSYQAADPILYLLINKNLSAEKIISLGFPSDLVKKVQQRLAAVKFKTKVPYELNQG
jgi:NAD+ synthase